MARHYYLTRSGRLRRKDNTLFFEPSKEDEDDGKDENPSAIVADADSETAEELITDSALNDLDDLSLEPPEFLSNEEGLTQDEIKALTEEQESPVKVKERRSIPVEDVDAIWVFRELDLNARVLNFLAQHKIPVHFFNYYGFYTGTYYPRDYLQAGYVLVRQVRHYSNKRLRLTIAKEFIQAGLHNILRNLRYYGNRGIELTSQTEVVQVEFLRAGEAKRIDELMSCEGRARAAYYQAFGPILKNEVDFSKRVRRPPDNMVNAMISYANGLVYSATLSQIYRSQLDPTISFLHEPGYRRFSLALDLAEVFKPILADRLIFKLFNNRQLNERDFAQDLNCCYLKPAGRKTVLREWDARLQTTIEHRRLKRKVSYERLIRLECYKLVKHLTNDEPYTGFRAWW